MRPFVIFISQRSRGPTPGRSRSAASRLARAAGALAVVAAASFHGAVRAQPGPPNVLLVTIDTLRADRVGAYGYKGARTPVLDRLAAEGVRFADATAHAPLTHPAHAAILTGRYPSVFGIRLNGMNPLPAGANTVAERLKAAGYRTGAVVASVILERAFGLDQGFDDYDDRIAVRPSAIVATADLQRSAAEVTDAALRWLGPAEPRAPSPEPRGPRPEPRAPSPESRGPRPEPRAPRPETRAPRPEPRAPRPEPRAPWFLWVHYYDPHLPYTAPPAHQGGAPDRPYDAEIAYVDAELGRLLAAVDRRRTVLVVTADHGESLGDHGEPDHGLFLYDATLHVPLVIAGPSLAPRVVTEQVRSIDLAPTIADLAGLDRDADADGVSLVPLLRGGVRKDVPVSLAESWYPRLHFGWSELRSARVGEWKYIAAPKPELYDLRSDRAERKNVVQDRAAVAGRLAAEIARLPSAAAKHAAPAAQPDPATVQRLQALGYVGTVAPVTSGSGGDNPLDRIADYRAYRDLFRRALVLLGEKRPAAAAGILQKLVKTNVRAFEAHLYLGNAYAALSKAEAALGEYDMAGLLNPSLAMPDFEAAKVISGRGDHAAAAARARAGLAKEPRSFYGHYTLGVIHQRAAQWPEALAAFSRAVEINDRDPRAHANLAGAAMRTGDLDLAATHFARMIELKHQVAPAHFNLGVIAARKGDRAEAARRYKLALEADPKFKPAREALDRLQPERGAGQRLRPERGANPPSESAWGWGPTRTDK